jgi:acetolactate synthase-1/2/3 large subunit
MNASEAAVKFLEDYGVRYVFGLPGIHNLPLFDALRDSQRIRTMVVRNESAARSPSSVRQNHWLVSSKRTT